MRTALYDENGFYARGRDPGGAGGHFRTSAHASPLFATAVVRLVVAADEALGRPDRLDVVDIGAGGGHLLRRIAGLAPTYLARRLRLRAVELAPRPAGLPPEIEWSARSPDPASLRGLVVATEWLDTVPLDIAEAGAVGDLHYRLVEPGTGAESAGPPVSAADGAWAERWWPPPPAGWPRGARVELGGPRDIAWAGAVAALRDGFAVTVDYGHTRADRPPLGTLTGFRAGREVAAVPDGRTDLTAHVAIDAVAAAGEAVAGQRSFLSRQRSALARLGIDGSRPPLSRAGDDPAGYVRALADASQAAELTDAAGLGGHYWLVQPVGLDATTLPAGLGG